MFPNDEDLIFYTESCASLGNTSESVEPILWASDYFMHRNTDINGNNAWNVGVVVARDLTAVPHANVPWFSSARATRHAPSTRSMGRKPVQCAAIHSSALVYVLAEGGNNTWLSNAHRSLLTPADGYLYASGLHVYILYTLQFNRYSTH